MLNVSDRATERGLLESLTQEDPELVEEIRRLMFVFEDIGKFTDKDIQTVLKNVETSQWAMALKGASEALKEKILKNMSERAAETLARGNGVPRPGQALASSKRSSRKSSTSSAASKTAARSISTRSTKTKSWCSSSRGSRALECECRTTSLALVRRILAPSSADPPTLRLLC